jgi:hypothetical protein
MRYLFKISLSLLVCSNGLLLPSSHAQSISSQDALSQKSTSKALLQKNLIKKPQPIQKEFSVGARLFTDGWGVFAERGTVKSEEKESDLFYHLRFYQLEIGEHKHAKEVKVTNTGPNYGDKPRPYKYGKINNFYTLKLGYGFRKMIAGKPDPGTVSIHWVYAGGLSIGMLKPYYLDAVVENGRLKAIKYDDAPEYFLPDPPNQMRIVGHSSFFEGIGKTKIVPGIYAKTGLHFDIAALRKRKLAIETGLSGELYTQKMPIVATVKAFPYVLNGYISIQFGNRK